MQLLRHWTVQSVHSAHSARSRCYPVATREGLDRSTHERAPGSRWRGWLLTACVDWLRLCLSERERIKVTNILCLGRSVLGIGVIAAVLAGCGGPQSGLGAIPQKIPAYIGTAAQPDVGCPVVGHHYYTGGGHFELVFASAKFVAGSHADRVKVDFHFTKWPQQRPLPDWTAFLTTCGPESGKRPIGKILNRLSPLWSKCRNQICDIYFPEEVYYEPPLKLLKGRPWQYDEIAFKFKAKGWGTLGGARIVILK